MQAERHYSYDDYAALPEGAPVQLIDGELLVSPAPSLRHQRIVGRLYVLLFNWVQRHRCGEVFVSPVDVILSRHDVVQPDVVFVAAGREAILAPEGIRGAPDVCIEVLSPGNARLDRVRKRALYARNGVAELWLVDPDAATIELYRLQDAADRPSAIARQGERLASVALPGLRVDVDAVVAE